MWELQLICDEKVRAVQSSLLLQRRMPESTLANAQAHVQKAHRENLTVALAKYLSWNDSSVAKGGGKDWLGGGKATVVVGAFTEHSAHAPELVDELAAAGAHKAAQKYQLPTHRAKAKSLLYTQALGAPAWGALVALLHHRLAFIGAPGHRPGGGDALERTRRRVEERTGLHTEAALQLLASPYGLRGIL
jgi:hypothetical protein